ncbi:hypothetical protein GF312_11250 [Candidatus Poribacteria bacterium]|nr:hypothetical protein [Candidatus Poribacteria bacterium]
MIIYNFRRPNSAIRYIVPADYYHANPDARIAERKEKLFQAVERRKVYWEKKLTLNEDKPSYF